LNASANTQPILEPLLVEELKKSLEDSLFERLDRAVCLSQEQLVRLERENRLLREMRRLDLLKKYGRAGEKLSDAQLELLEQEPGVSAEEVEAESERAPLPRKKRRKHPGRQQLSAHLPRVEQIIACTPEQCVCPKCAKETTVIGYEQSEQLDVEPAKYFVRVIKREKRACKDCQEEGVKCAPVPARIIEKGLASDRVVIDTVISKYADHLPLYRQSVILQRETGLEISRATLDSWVMTVGELSRPIQAAMAKELLGGSYIQADETTVGVQMHDGRGKNHQAYLWQYSPSSTSFTTSTRVVSASRC
jgi:transposase